MPTARKTLTPTVLAELRRPFSAEAIRVKALTKAGDDGKASAAYYIDARLVAERLNAVVGPAGWSDDYEFVIGNAGSAQALPALYFPVICRLTVCGVTKVDVGQVGSANVTDNVWKSAISDSFKRAAVKFGIGAHLYAIPRIRVKAKTASRNGQVKTIGLHPTGQDEAIKAYRRWLANETLNRFGEPFDHGDVVGLADDEERSDADEESFAQRDEPVQVGEVEIEWGDEPLLAQHLKDLFAACNVEEADSWPPARIALTLAGRGEDGRKAVAEELEQFLWERTGEVPAYPA